MTDRVFSRRLKDLLSSDPIAGRREIELLKLGRHFRIGPETKIIVGRNRAENQSISQLANKKDILLLTSSVPGPTAFVAGETSPASEEMAALLTVSYSDAEEGKAEEVILRKRGRERIIRVAGRPKEEFRRYMI